MATLNETRCSMAVPKDTYTIIQSHNIGTAQGVHNGDNVIYNNIGCFTRKHTALKTQNKKKQSWMESETCDWFLKKKEFKSWESSKSGNLFLWLYGRRGCGKSILMSRIISKISQDVSDRDSSSSHPVLYFFVDDDYDKEPDRLYQSIIITFWEQAIKPIHRQTTDISVRSPIHQPTEHELLELLASSREDIYIIVDALDQLPSQPKSRLLRWLYDLSRSIETGTCNVNLRVAISSRDCKDINQERMSTLFPVEVTAEENTYDIEKFLGKNLNSYLLEQETKLRERVFDELRKHADGIFLWAALQARNICNMETRHEPNGQEDWLFHDLKNDSNIIVRYCNHLVRINENLEVFQFCHGTTFEFFKNYKPDIYHHEIANLCLYQLSLPELSQSPRDDINRYHPGSIRSIIQKHPFLPFASSKWATSIKNSYVYNCGMDIYDQNSETLSLLKNILDLNPAVEKKQNLQLALQVHFLSLGKTMLSQVSYEHIICYYGLVKLFEAFWKRGWFNLEEPDSDGLKPIHWAIRNDTKADFYDVGCTVEKLIESGANINAKDSNGNTPLYYAAYHGNHHVVGLLLSKKAKIDLTNKNNESALIVAGRKHRENIILALAKVHASTKIRSSFGTALQVISLTGCCKCADAIINCYQRSKIAEKDGPFGTSLHAAAFHGHLELVKLLCSKLVNLHAISRTYGTALTAAATGFNYGLDPTPFLEIIEELVQHGIDINNRDGLVGPALRIAAYHGNAGLVHFLLSKGAKVSKSAGLMGTAYDAAKERGNHDIKEILLGNDPKAADYVAPSTSRPQEQQFVHRILFKATVEACNIHRIDNLITQYKKFVEKEIRKGESPFLEGLVQLGVDCFKDVIELVIGERRNSSKDTGSQDNDNNIRIRDVIFGLFCLKFPIITKSKISGTTPGEYRALEHLPQVLDRMTQAAVKILVGCAGGERCIIRLIAGRLVDALESLVFYPGFGEEILESVLWKRAEELKVHSTNPTLSQIERLEKAKALVAMGIELLLVAVERQNDVGKLPYLISNHWVKAVIDVVNLIKEEAATQELIDIFTKGFSEAMRIENQANAEVYAGASVEFMRATAMNSKTGVWEKFKKEWVSQWELVLDGGMKYVAEDLIKRRQSEYERCIQEGRSDEGFGLVLVCVEVLGAAIKYKREPVIAMLESCIQSSIKSMLKNPLSSIKAAGRVRDENLGRIFDAFVRLFGTAEEIQPGHFKSLASTILEYASFPEDGHQEELLSAIIIERLKDARRIIDLSERQKELVHLYRTLFFALEVILDSREPKTALSSSLKKAVLEGSIGTQLNFTQMDELECYKRANDYVRMENDSVPGNG
ncbi:hypothetical protein F4806DRAFT_505546 [Annulohypoxylon nitens]|nr:hypothetical protein F4806DRAFT_505546 [Annulohypoxylon nitens]